MRRLVSLAVAALVLSACPTGARPCLEDEECFGGEFCTIDSVCAPYDGTRRVGPAPGSDLGSPGTLDTGNPFVPSEPDIGFPRFDAGAPLDAGGDPAPEDAGRRDVGDPFDVGDVASDTSSDM